MRRILITLIFSLALTGHAIAEKCVTKKVAIAISNPEDYMNMLFTAGLGGENNVQEFAMELVKNGKATFLLKGEEVELLYREKETSIVMRNGRSWIIPSVVLQCE